MRRLRALTALALAPALVLGACGTGGSGKTEPTPTVDVAVDGALPAGVTALTADPLFLLGQDDAKNSRGEEQRLRPMLVLHTTADTPGVATFTITIAGEGFNDSEWTTNAIPVPAGESTVLAEIDPFVLKNAEYRDKVSSARVTVDEFTPNPDIVEAEDVVATVDLEREDGAHVKVTGTVRDPLAGDPSTIGIRVLVQCTTADGDFAANGSGFTSTSNSTGPIEVPYEMSINLHVTPGDALAEDSTCQADAQVQHPQDAF